MYADRVDCTINMGGTAEVNNSFCPWSGAEAFFYYLLSNLRRGVLKNVLSGL